MKAGKGTKAQPYHVPDVVLLFRQLRGWFELRVLSIFIVGGPCWFFGILGVLNGISFDYTDRRSTLPYSDDNSLGLNAKPYTATT